MESAVMLVASAGERLGMWAVILALFFVPVGILVWLVVASNRAVRRNYAELSAKFGLVVDISRKVGLWAHPAATGEVRGRETAVRSAMAGGRRPRPMTLVLVRRAQPDALTLALRRNRFLGRQGGEKYFPTGDAAFDAAWVVASNDAERARRVLGDAVRAKLVEASRLGFWYDSVTAGDRDVKLEMDLLLGATKKRVYVERMIEVLHDLADGIDATAQVQR